MILLRIRMLIFAALAERYIAPIMPLKIISKEITYQQSIQNQFLFLKKRKKITQVSISNIFQAWGNQLWNLVTLLVPFVVPLLPWLCLGLRDRDLDRGSAGEVFAGIHDAASGHSKKSKQKLLSSLTSLVNSVPTSVTRRFFFKSPMTHVKIAKNRQYFFGNCPKSPTF